MKTISAFLSCALIGALASSPSQAQEYTFLDPLTLFGPHADGSLRPGDRSYLTTGDAQRGLAFNPATGYLVFVDRATGTASSTFSGAVHILDRLSGDSAGTLDPTGIQGGNFANFATAVADDGAIYLGNEVNNGTTTHFKLYRWPDDFNIQPPTVAFDGDPGNGRPQRWGDTMDVRGSGANTQIILGTRTSGSVIGTNVAILTTVDGVNFTARTLTLDVSDSATGGGIAFGAGNTFWAKNVDVTLRQFAFDLAAGTATTIRSYGPEVLPGSRTVETLAVKDNLLAAIDMTAATDNLRLYDISDPNNPPVLLDVRDFPVNNANASTTKGYLDFGDDFGEPLLFAHNINNGLMAFSLHRATTSAPAIRSQPRPQRVLSGRTVTLEVLAYPSATYQWQRNGANVDGATSAVLRLVNAQPSQAGTYRVLISNAGGTTISDEVSVSIINPADLYHLSPLWSKAPAAAVNVTNYATSFGGTSTPNERNLAYNPNLNQLYVQQRDGNGSTRFAIHVVDAATGTWLHTLKTNGVFLNVPAFSGSTGIAIDGLAVAADGSIYACNMSADSCGCANANGVFRVYRWASSDPSTLPVQVFQGEPTAQSVSLRWGDVLTVRGGGIGTEILLDNQNGTARYAAILKPVDENMGSFTAQVYTQVVGAIPGSTIGRSLQYGALDTFWQKRKAAALVESSFDASSTSVTATYPNFPAAIGQVALDFGRNLVLGIDYAANNATVPDTLDLYDFSDRDLPLLLAQYNFPIIHQNNANFIGQVLISGDKVFALDGNNGILAFRIVSGPQSPPTILGQPRDTRVIEGNAASVSVITADLASFQWQLNSNNIPGATAVTYDISSATPAQAGAYRVIVSNEAGSVTSLVATVTVLPASEFARLAPLWSLAPLSRPYLRKDGNTAGQTPLYRGIAYNALSNQVYLITRTTQTAGLEVNVLNASTGEHLYQLNTNGISGRTIVLLGMDVADDGAIYAASMADFPTDLNATYVLYRWTNSAPDTVPVQVYSGDPGFGVIERLRWGDTLDVRGAGANTEIIVDANSATAAAVFKPVDETMNSFTPTAFAQASLSGSIGRSLQFGDANSFWQKRKGSRLQLSTFDLAVPSSTIVSNFPNFPASLGPVALDTSRNLLAGIDFASSTNVPDAVALYDVSDLENPLLIARYNFPTNQQPNGNFIGQVLFAGNRVWAVDGNNGVMAFSIVAPSGPPLRIEFSGADVLISWDAAASDFVLQKSPTLTPANWLNVTDVPDIQNGRKTITQAASDGSQFYRLCRACP